MAENRAAWEIRTSAGGFGFLIWLGDAQLHAALDVPFQNLIRGWLQEFLGSVEDRVVESGEISSFAEEILPRRLTGLTVSRADPDDLPLAHSWLAILENDRIPRLGEWDRAGWRSNRWEPAITVRALLEGTRSGRYRWCRGRHGGFKGGGRDPDALETWMTLARCGGPFALVIRRRRELVGGPVLQRDGWMSRCDLHRLWNLLDATTDTDSEEPS